tara:strand:- start:549 stop:929 length:381 start_codon:yes stop_codon:yes gene_type:complete
VNDEVLRPYFALPSVLDGLFGVINRLFSVTIEAADGEAPIWHDDVRFFKVVEDGDPIVSTPTPPAPMPTRAPRPSPASPDLRRFLPVITKMRYRTEHLVCCGQKFNSLHEACGVVAVLAGASVRVS